MFQRHSHREDTRGGPGDGGGIGGGSIKVLAPALGFLFGNMELSLELWNIIAGISGFDDWGESGMSLYRAPVFLVIATLVLIFAGCSSEPNGEKISYGTEILYYLPPVTEGKAE